MTQALSMELPPTFKVDVQTTNNRGFTPEEIAERCVDRIVSVSDHADPMVKDRKSVVLIDAAQPELAELIRRL